MKRTITERRMVPNSHATDTARDDYINMMRRERWTLVKELPVDLSGHEGFVWERDEVTR